MSWFNWRTSGQADAATQSGVTNSASALHNLQNEDRLRTVARRRLIGAAILVGLTVLIFPWVFKQQPKPLNDDLIIEVPRKDAAKTIQSQATVPAATTAASQAAPTVSVTSAANVSPAPVTSMSISNATTTSTNSSSTEAAPSTPKAVETAAIAATAATAIAVAAKPTSNAQVAKSNTKPSTSVANKEVPKSEPKAVVTQPAAATGGRYVVQVAAFAEASKAREVRIKLESQGYKTYSQAIDSPKGKVWRVRVGPFDNKAAAEKAKSQLSGKGFQPALLEL